MKAALAADGVHPDPHELAWRLRAQVFKGGHNDTTGNQAFCVEKVRRCVVFLANDVRAEGIYQALAEASVGDPGMP